MPLNQVHQRWNENTKFNSGYHPAIFERSYFRLSNLRKQANITAFATSINSFYIKYAKYTFFLKEKKKKQYWTWRLKKALEPLKIDLDLTAS